MTKGMMAPVDGQAGGSAGERPTARAEDDMFRIDDEEEQTPKSPEQVLAMHKLNGLQKGDEVEVDDITTVLGGVVFEVGQLLHQNLCLVHFAVCRSPRRKMEHG